jgi:hypothetical protein
MSSNKSRDLRLSSQNVAWTKCGSGEQWQQVPCGLQLLTGGVQGYAGAELHSYWRNVRAHLTIMTVRCVFLITRFRLSIWNGLRARYSYQGLEKTS